MTELTLFDGIEISAPNAPNISETPLDLPLTHPYTRYGLAVAMLQARLNLEQLNEANLRTALLHSIEVGLEYFRMRTGDKPAIQRLLQFTPIPFAELASDTTLVGSSGLANKGIDLFPTILTTDKSVKQTFASATSILALLKEEAPLDKSVSFSRLFAPTTAKINNKRSFSTALTERS